LKTDWIIASGFFTVGFISRLLFHVHSVYNWDSADFALGLERYSIREFQPHPPGYILYTAAGRILQFFLRDAGNALVAISIISGAAAVAGLFLLGRSIFDRPTGIVAAVLLLFSPSAWFYSEIQLTYELELILAIVVTWFLYQMFFFRKYTILAAIVIGIAGGFRQDLLIFLGPFWFVGSLRAGRRTMLISWAALAGSVLIWALPLLYYSGGVAAYRAMSDEQYDVGVYPYSILATGFSAFAKHLQEVWQGTLWLFGFATIMLVYVLSILANLAKPKEHTRVLFLLMLLVPALAFFLLFLFNPPGYLLIIAAPMLLLLARLIVVNGSDIDELWSRNKGPATAANGWRPTLGQIFITAILLIVAVGNTVMFTKAADIKQEVPSSGGTVASIFGLYSWGSIRQADQEIDAMKAVMSRFDPDNTAIVVTILSDWRRLMYYFPDYHVYPLHVDNPTAGYCDSIHHYYRPIDSREIPLPASITQLIFFKMDTSPTLAKPIPETSSGVAITIAEVPASGSLKVGAFTFSKAD
jgi:hypothetical protein